MKRIFLSMLAAAGLLVTSCEKRDLEPTVGAGAEVPITISASMEGATTRAIANYGTASKVNRAILEVYYDGEVYKRMVAPLDTESNNTKTADFDLRLISGREYNFVVWADKVNATVAKEESYNSEDNTNIDLYYETNNGLDEITIIEDEDYLGCNDDERDAFYGVQTKKVEGATTVTMTLRRPFGQINVLTKLTGVKGSDLPEFVQVTYSTDIAHTFNALSEETSNYKALAWSNIVSVIESATSDVTEAIHLSTDYIFAPKDGQDLVDFSMEFFKQDGTSITTNNKLSNIPVQRNCRTNVSGELLNENVDVDVNIDSTPSEIKGVETIAELNTAMSNDIGEKDASYVVNGEITEDGSTITIPDFNRCDATRSITLKEGIANSTTLKITTNNTNSPATDPKFVYITVPENNQGSLDIDLPNSTVYINGTCYGLNAATYEDTLIIQEGAVVTNLTISKGNVEIYGKVATLTVDAKNTAEGLITIFPGAEVTTISKLANYSLTKAVSTIDELRAAIGVATEVVLASDIEMVNADPKDSSTGLYINSEVTINGKGFTISGYTGNGGNLIAATCKATLKNLTIAQTGVDFTTAANKANGLTAYDHNSDVILENVTIKDCGKAAMIVNCGNVTATDFNTSGNAWGAVNVSMGSNMAFYKPTFNFVSGTLSEQNQIWVDGVSEWEVTTPEGETWYEGFSESTYLYNTNNIFAATNVNTGISYMSIAAAISAASEGNTIELAAGEFEENIVFAQNGITIKGANSGVSGLSEDRVSETILTGQISINKNNITFDGVRFTGNSTSPAKIVGNNVDGFTFINNVADGIDTDLIYFGDSAINKNILIENNKITCSNGYGKTSVLLTGTVNTVVRGNYISDASRGLLITASPYAEDLTIENNFFTNNSYFNMQITGTVGNLIVRGNTLSNERGAASEPMILAWAQNDGDTDANNMDATYLIENNTFDNLSKGIKLLLELDGDRSASFKEGQFKINNNTFNFSNPAASGAIINGYTSWYTGWVGTISFEGNVVNGLGESTNPADYLTPDSDSDDFILVDGAQFDFGDGVVLPAL